MRNKVKRFLPGIIWFFILLVLLCIPGSDLPKAEDWMQSLSIDKLIHTGLFGILSYLFMKPVTASGFCKPRKWRIIIVIALATSGWGLTTELIQENFVRGRNFEWLDWGADSLGALIALIINKLRNLK